MRWLAYGKIENLGNFLVKNLGFFIKTIAEQVVLLGNLLSIHQVLIVQLQFHQF